MDLVTIQPSFDKYLKETDLDQLFRKLGATQPRKLANTVKHFTTKEAEKRDKIIIGYFGQKGIKRMVDSIVKSLLADPTLSRNGNVLDAGAGSGFFTAKVENKIHSIQPKVGFYAMDLTPAMLRVLARNTDIAAFLGLAENLNGSILEARKHFRIPLKFDAVFSTLMLHHSISPERVFESLSQVLKKNGKAIIIDLCQHSFKEFKVEMGDIHLGFNPETIRRKAETFFSNVEVKNIPGIACKSSRRSAEIFVATMQKPIRNALK
jgi:SAM-dependent methyltransferase